MAHYYMGELQAITGDDEGALGSQEASIAILEALVAYDPANSTWRMQAAVSRRQLAVTLGRLGRRPESLRGIREALTMLEPWYKATLPGSSGVGPWHPSTHSALARALVAFGEPAMALHEAETAQILLADAPGEGQGLPFTRGEIDLVLGHAFFGLGNESEARDVWSGALATLLQLVEGPGGAEFRPMLAEAYVVLGRAEEARHELENLRARGYGHLYLLELSREREIIL